MTKANLHFVCLEERKKRRSRLFTILSNLGTIRWRKAPFLSLRGFAETRLRAEEALQGGKKVPVSRLLRAVKIGLLRLCYNGSRWFFVRNPRAIAVTWNAQSGTRKAFMDGARDAGALRLYIELGVFPNTVTIDPCGVNFSNGLPRRIEPYRAWASATGERGAWRGVSGLIRQRSPAKTNKMSMPGLPALDEPFLFVPLQYPEDSQLRIYGGAFRTLETFVQALAKAASALPIGWHLRVKEHPSAPNSIAPLIGKISVGLPLFLDNQTDTFEQVRRSRGVITVNSSVGLEAMLFDKPVVACGDCYWAIDGVARHAPDLSSLTAVMAAPGELTFDLDARNPFLDFLTMEYYPRLLAQGLTPEQYDKESAKVLRRLFPQAGDPIWGARC